MVINNGVLWVMTQRAHECVRFIDLWFPVFRVKDASISIFKDPAAATVENVKNKWQAIKDVSPSAMGAECIKMQCEN